MLISIIFTLLLGLEVQASFPDFFGAGVQNGSLGNQMSFEYGNPAHNFYVPASLAWNTGVFVSASATHINAEFDPISNVVIKNPTNNSDSPLTQTGAVNTDYGTHEHSAINASIPIKTYGNFGLSLFTPIASIMETNSGNAHLPEYVLYRSRYKRTQAFANYAHKLNDFVAFSLGVQLGFQAGANVETRAALNGTGYGSSATAKTQVDPTLGALFSIFFRLEKSHFYFTYQQEMKSNLESQAVGFTASPPVPFDVNIETMIYFDPHVMRFGYGKKWNHFHIMGSLEYQIWENYQTPIVRITANGGSLSPSDDFEKVQVRNILVPKFGFRFQPTDRIGINTGFIYRPSIFKQDYSGAGNSLDLDTKIFTAGMDYSFSVMSIPTQFGFAVQRHSLEEKFITKSSGLENGDPGQKIGSPGYRAGGKVNMLTTGIKVEF